MVQPIRSNRLMAWGVGACAMALAQSAGAMTIMGNYIDPGSSFPGSSLQGVAQPSTVTGSGNLQALFAAAASAWESRILDDYTLTIDYGWVNLSSSNQLAVTGTVTGGSPERAVSASLAVAADSPSHFYLDGTPEDSSEWSSFLFARKDLGGGAMDFQRLYTGAASPAVANNYDLLTVLSHEIAHALGFTSSSITYQSEATFGSILVEAPLPLAGSLIKTLGPTEAHLDPGVLPGALMQPTLAAGQRKEITDADVLAVAQVDQFSRVVLAPEPATFIFVLAALAGAGIRRPRQARN